jgi:hypothetical protein
MVMGGIAAVAVGSVLGVLALNGTGKISLSDHSSREHSTVSSQEHQTSSSHRTIISHTASSFSFSTLNNQNDPTFNQLLGINNRGLIAGYLGSGAQGHPNKGYLLNVSRSRSWYENENVPDSTQTQVTGLNDFGVTVGFSSNHNTASMVNPNFGFYTWGGRFHLVNFPTMNNASPAVNQLLGVNDSDLAVGFYTDAKGNNHGYTYSITRHRFRSIYIWGATSLTPSAINNAGDIAGFFTNSAGVVKAFLLYPNGRLTTLAFPGATMTQAFGVNDSREVVGAYTIGSGSSAKTFGFTWTSRGGWKTVSDPLGVGATTINGVNNAGELVGFYTDAAGNTDGLLWAGGRFTAPLAPRLAQSVTVTVKPAAVTPTVTVTPATSAGASVPASGTSQPSHW